MPIASLVRLLVLAALWGGSFLLLRITAPVLGALPTAFGRVLLGAAGLLALVLVMRMRIAFQGKLPATMMLGVINSGIPFLMYALAARVLPAGYSAILNATTPLMGVLIGALAFGEQATLRKLAGVLAGLVGVGVLMGGGPLGMNAATALGVGFCLVATGCYGLAGFLTQRWIARRGGLDSRLVAFGSQVGAVLVLLPFILIEAIRHPIDLRTIDAPVWLAWLMLGLLCTSWAYVLYFRLIADLGPLKALTVTFLIPLFGVFWGWLVLGEPVGLAHVLGGGLIALALRLVMSPSAPTRKAGDQSISTLR
ncbi:DMT family transporter [Diaphorobacter ruginosibacter]|uniref:DMT family transporter n=1 Tax=Diaphorobacter ruginosibacter TaxID=1715720 RepID=A0A7G9RPG9_9BURK|nr:DMT family transporter [Diaphorobacter ruginosibacter]QNN57494.1 DMT family transporter [Diaphorobacter ruginosibacter]